NALAMDVERYLSGEAVLARPPSVSYKFRKLAARNKLLFSGVVLIFVLLGISLILTTRLLIIERRTNEQIKLPAQIARLENLGFNLLYQLKYAEAESTYRKALALRAKLPGIESASETTCNHLMIIFQGQKRLDKVRPLLVQFSDQLPTGAFRD